MLATITIRSVLARKARILLTTLAVVVGVAFVSGAFILTDSLQKSFDSAITDIGKDIDLHVRVSDEFGSGSSYVPADLADQLAGIQGVDVVEPQVEGTALIIGKDGQPLEAEGGVETGTAWLGERSISGWRLREGTAPEKANEVALDNEVADRGNLAVGDTIQVAAGDGGKQEFTVVGIAGLGEDGNSFGDTYVLFDPATAKEVLGVEGFDSINVALTADADQDRVEASVRQLLPERAEVITGKELADENADNLASSINIIQNVLLGFALVALFVSAFLINNTFQIIVSQRLREMALLRAVGASGKQVRRMILLEATVIAGIATAVGFIAGMGVSKLLTALFNSAGGGGFPSAPIVLQPRTFIVAVIIGFGVTLSAALLPAIRASRIPPIAAMRPELAGGRGESMTRRVIGAVLALGGFALYVVGVLVRPGGGAALLMAGGGVVVGFIGVTMVAATFAGPVARVLGKPLAKLYGVPGELASENAARSPRRTASTSAALMIGVALVTAVGVLGASLQKSFSDQLDESIQADYFISSDGYVPEAVTEALATDPNFADATGLRFAEMKIQEDVQVVMAGDMTTLPQVMNLGVVDGGYEGLDDNGLMMLESEATDRGLGIGDTVAITWQSGERQDLTLIGLYDTPGFASDYLVDTSVFKAANPESQGDALAAARLAADGDPAAAQNVIDGLVAQYPQVDFEDRGDVKKSASGQIDQILTLIYMLLGFAVIIAVLGILNTLALAVFERTREFGLLRAVGTTKRQLKKTVRWESVIVSVFGALLGLAVGLPIGILGAQALKDIDFGITQIVVPWTTIIAILVLAVVAGLIAAIWPARRAAKLNVLDAIATS
jgi:putative ABC transport system permease protein